MSSSTADDPYFTVREPKRREVASKIHGRASAAEVRAFMRKNRATLICHHLGIALTIMTAYGFGNWMPTFFLRVHHWTPQRFSVLYGSINIVLGILAPLASGWLAGFLKERCMLDASWRITLVGSIGCATCGALAPLMPTPELSLSVHVLAGLFASPPAVDKASIGRSLALVSFVTGLPAALLLAFGLKSFRQSLARATWIASPAWPM